MSKGWRSARFGSTNVRIAAYRHTMPRSCASRPAACNQVLRAKHECAPCA